MLFPGNPERESAPVSSLRRLTCPLWASGPLSSLCCLGVHLTHHNQTHSSSCELFKGTRYDGVLGRAVGSFCLAEITDKQEAPLQFLCLPSPSVFLPRDLDLKLSSDRGMKVPAG